MRLLLVLSLLLIGCTIEVRSIKKPVRRVVVVKQDKKAMLRPIAPLLRDTP